MPQFLRQKKSRGKVILSFIYSKWMNSKKKHFSKGANKKCILFAHVVVVDSVPAHGYTHTTLKNTQKNDQRSTDQVLRAMLTYKLSGCISCLVQFRSHDSRYSKFDLREKERFTILQTTMQSTVDCCFMDLHSALFFCSSHLNIAHALTFFQGNNQMFTHKAIWEFSIFHPFNMKYWYDFTIKLRMKKY